MTDMSCAPCLLAGARRTAITIYGGAAVCDIHLIQEAGARFGTNFERSRAVLDFRKNVQAALGS